MMNLKVVSSGSIGNCYILENKTDALLIECGTSWKRTKQALNFDVSKVSGCLITHEHGDHCSQLNSVVKNGIDCFMSQGTFEAIQEKSKKVGCGNHRLNFIEKNKPFDVGPFKVIAFSVKHDAKDPLGFLIYHEDCGTVLYLTDTNMIHHKFNNLNNILIECNYSDKIMAEQIRKSTRPKFVYERTRNSHLSLEQCKMILVQNNLDEVNNIVLIHLSDGNSNEAEFQQEIESLTGKTTTIAKKELILNFNKNPF